MVLAVPTLVIATLAATACGDDGESSVETTTGGPLGIKGDETNAGGTSSAGEPSAEGAAGGTETNTATDDGAGGMTPETGMTATSTGGSDAASDSGSAGTPATPDGGGAGTSPTPDIGGNAGGGGDTTFTGITSAAQPNQLAQCESFENVCQAERIVDNLAHSRVLKAHDGYLYTISQGAVTRAPIAGGTPETIRPPSTQTMFLDFDSSGQLYYSARGAQSGIHRGQPSSPDSDERLFDLPDPWGFAIAEGRIYAGATSGTLHGSLVLGESPALGSMECLDFSTNQAQQVFCRANPTTSAASLFHLNANPDQTEPISTVDERIEDLASNNAFVYLIGALSNRFSRISTTSSTEELLSEAFNPSTVETDEGGAYVSVETHGSTTAVYYIGDASTELIPIATVDAPNLEAWTVTIDDAYAYWIENNPDDTLTGALYRAPRCGCP